MRGLVTQGGWCPLQCLPPGPPCCLPREVGGGKHPPSQVSTKVPVRVWFWGTGHRRQQGGSGLALALVPRALLLRVRVMPSRGALAFMFHAVTQ